MDDILLRIEDLEQSALSIQAEERQTLSEWRLRIIDSENELTDKREEISTLETEIRVSSTIVAPVTGTVTEVAASLGDVVVPGTPIVRVIQESDRLDALVKVPLFKGKQIRSGMHVQFAPGTVKREEFGTIMGRVNTVSPLPISRSALRAMLHNERLVDFFMRDGPPIVVRVDLEHDFNTPTGLRWSGGTGPAQTISPGTAGRASIAVREQAPITLVLPFLRSLTGL